MKFDFDMIRWFILIGLLIVFMFLDFGSSKNKEKNDTESSSVNLVQAFLILLMVLLFPYILTLIPPVMSLVCRAPYDIRPILEFFAQTFNFTLCLLFLLVLDKTIPIPIKNIKTRGRIITIIILVLIGFFYTPF